MSFDQGMVAASCGCAIGCALGVIVMLREYHRLGKKIDALEDKIESAPFNIRPNIQLTITATEVKQ